MTIVGPVAPASLVDVVPSAEEEYLRRFMSGVRITITTKILAAWCHDCGADVALDEESLLEHQHVHLAARGA